ncbi:MAG: hypothetical protein KC594_17785 [Nitrospira sp.]|nr:hypothetical protein [Nitrospira sp.]
MPAQMARFSQHESYEQCFSGWKTDKDLEQGLTTLIGERNLEALRLQYPEADAWSFQNCDFRMFGTVSLTVSIDPFFEADRFYVEGLGRYSARDSEGWPILTGDYYISHPGPHRIEELKDPGILLIKVRQTVMPTFSAELWDTAFGPQSDVQALVYLTVLMTRDFLQDYLDQAGLDDEEKDKFKKVNVASPTELKDMLDISISQLREELKSVPIPCADDCLDDSKMWHKHASALQYLDKSVESAITSLQNLQRRVAGANGSQFSELNKNMDRLFHEMTVLCDSSCETVTAVELSGADPASSREAATGEIKKAIDVLVLYKAKVEKARMVLDMYVQARHLSSRYENLSTKMYTLDPQKGFEQLLGESTRVSTTSNTVNPELYFLVHVASLGPRSRKSRIFSIDYTQGHEVYQMDSAGEPQFLGCLWFVTGGPAKLIDLRQNKLAKRYRLNETLYRNINHREGQPDNPYPPLSVFDTSLCERQNLPAPRAK